MEGSSKYVKHASNAHYTIRRAMKKIKLDDAVEFTNSAGRTITGTVTSVEGSWVTVWEQPGSVYRLPVSALKLVRVPA